MLLIWWINWGRNCFSLISCAIREHGVVPVCVYDCGPKCPTVVVVVVVNFAPRAFFLLFLHFSRVRLFLPVIVVPFRNAWTRKHKIRHTIYERVCVCRMTQRFRHDWSVASHIKYVDVAVVVTFRSLNKIDLFSLDTNAHWKMSKRI